MSDPIRMLNDVISRSTVSLRKGAEVTTDESGAVHLWFMPHGDEAPPLMPKVDVHFFTVGIVPEGDELKEEFIQALASYPEPERLAQGPSYIELGGVLGDQSQALRMIGLGTHYGLWQAITPKALGIEGPMADEMAGSGMVMLSGYRIPGAQS